MQIKRLVLQTAASITDMHTFYNKVLGFATNTVSATGFEVQAGSSALAFEQTQLIGRKPFYHFAFNIPSNKMEEAVAFLQAKGIDILPIQTTNADGETEENAIAELEDWNARACYFLDPAGNIVEFIVRLDSRYTSLKPFAAERVLSLSELGLACANAKTYAQTLREKYDLTSFTKSSNNERFWALGGDAGLLILCAAARAWFPTERLAESFPLRLVFKNRKNIDCELEIF